MKKLIFITVTCISLLASCKNGKSDFSLDGKTTVVDSAVSTIHVAKDAGGNLQIEKNNTDFEILPFYKNNKEHLVLIKTQNKETQLAKNNEIHNEITVSSKSLSSDFAADATIQVKANSVDFSNKYLVAQYNGNDKLEDSYEAYSLINGKKLMQYTYKDFLVMIPNTSERRLLGYCSKSSIFSDKMDEKNLGTLQYCSTENPIQQISIQPVQNIGIPNYTPDMQFTVVENGGTNLANDNQMVILTTIPDNFTAKDITNFGIQINYHIQNSSNVYSITIPVENDRLNIAKATYDRSIFKLVE